MNLAKILIDAYPGEVTDQIPEHAQASFAELAEYCRDPDGVDSLFSDVVLSIYTCGHAELTDEDFLPIAIDVLMSYKDDIETMLAAVIVASGEQPATNTDWVVGSTVEVDDETGERLYWSNEDGWVDKGSATRYTTENKQATQYLPKDSEWVALVDQTSISEQA